MGEDAAAGWGAGVIEGFRLSPQQRRLWQLASDGGGGCWVQCTVRLSGRRGGDVLHAAAESVFGRYQALRTGFRLLPTMDLPVQVTDLQPRFGFEHVAQGPEADDSSLASVKAHEQDRVGDPDGPASVRLCVVDLTGERSALVVTASALCADARSLQILVSELLDASACGEAGPMAPVDPEPLEYLDYSEWRHDVMNSVDSHDGRAHWTSALRSTTKVVLPSERGAARHRAERVSVAPAPDVVGRLSERSTERGVSVQALLLAGWHGLLRRLSGREDVVVNVLVDGRKFEELEAAVGSFAEYLPVVGPDNGASLVEAARHLDGALVQAAELQEHFVRDEPAAGTPADPPLLGFRMDEWAQSPALDRVTATVEDLCSLTERFRLQLVWSALGGVATAQLQFDAARFTRSRVEGWLDAYLELLADGLDRPDAPIAGLRLASPARSDALAQRSSGPRLAVGHGWLHQQIEMQAERTPDALAVLFDTDTVSFGDLNRRANRLARRLRLAGARPETFVALLLERSVDQLIAVLATLKAGAAYLPLDVAHPTRRSALVLEQVRPVVLLAHSVPDPDLTRHARAVVVIDRESDAADEISDANLDIEVSGGDLAYAIATSGSTGAPKAVMVQHSALANMAAGLEHAVYPSSSPPLRVSLNAPLSFDASLKQVVQLGRGRTVCVVSEEDRRIGPQMLDGLARDRVDVLDCTPSHLRMLLAAGMLSAWGHPGVALIGGEAIDPSTWDRLAADTARRYFNVYGPTETTVVASAAEVQAGSSPTIGQALANVALYVLDDALQPVPEGFVGELCIGGAGVARGYVGRPVATAERFVPDPFSSELGARLYRTGDRGRRGRDGLVEFLGRSDRQVKVRGVRVEPAEIEVALAEHPRVGLAVVVAQEDEAGDARLVAYVTEPTTVFSPPDGTALHRLPNGKTVAHHNRNETEYLYHEIFEKEAYVRHGIRLHDGMCVFDVGANIGMFSLFVHSRVENARIYAFEPIAPVSATLRANAGMHGMQLTALPFGLADGDRVERFSHYPRYTMMTGLADYADPEGEVEVIKAYLVNEQRQGLLGRESLLDRVDELLEDRFRAELHECRLRRLSDVIAELDVDSIDLLKIDVQRAELQVLMGLDEADWRRVHQVVCEVHDKEGTPSEGRLATMAALLQDHGFEVVVEQDELLMGTDRHNLYATRPGWSAGRLSDHDLIAPPPATPAVDPLTSGSLREFLLERLPEHMIPVSFVRLDEFPRTSNGKIDLTALAVEEALPAGRCPAAAESLVEAALVDIWTRVLQVGDVGIDDNFFDLGGDSIRSIQVQAAAQRAGIRFSLQDAFRFQTIRELADRVFVDKSTAPAEIAVTPFSMISDADRAILPDGLVDAYPLASLQAGMIFHSELRADPATYHNVSTLRLRAPFDAARLEDALAATIARHPVLRTSFNMSAFSEPLQLVHERVAPNLLVTDVAQLAGVEQDRVIDAAVEAERRRAFDWGSPPLLRFEAFDRGDGTFEILWAEYHGILDGWSLHLLLYEVLRRFTAALRDEAPVLDPPSQRSYGDFVALERETAADPRHHDFWVAKLSSRLPAALPTEQCTEVGGRDRETRLLEASVEDGVTAALRNIAHELGVPLKSLLLAAYFRVLQEVTGGDDLATGLVVNGREEREGGDVVLGLFLNVVPLCWRPVTASDAELARWLFEEERELLPHRRYPAARMQRDVGGRRLLDNLFNFTQFHELGGEDAQPAAEIVGRRGIAVDIDLTLAADAAVDPITGALQLTFQYDATQLSGATVADMAALFRAALASMARDPHRRRTGTSVRPGTALPLPRALLGGSWVEDDAALPSTGLEAVPLTDDEAEVAGVWAAVLGRADIGIHNSFQDLGGHSLVATQIVAHLRQRFGVELRLSEFLDAPTVAGNLACIRRAQGLTTCP